LDTIHSLALNLGNPAEKISCISCRKKCLPFLFEVAETGKKSRPGGLLRRVPGGLPTHIESQWVSLEEKVFSNAWRTLELVLWSSLFPGTWSDLSQNSHKLFL